MPGNQSPQLPATAPGRSTETALPGEDLPKGVSPQPDKAGALPRLHLDHVDGLRALAALIVFVNHAYAQVWNPIRNQYPQGVFSPFSYSLVAGHLSVTVFIVLSGFCLALPVLRSGDRLRGGTKQFLGRRARRILPPYYGALALTLLLIATVIGQKTGTIWDVPLELTWVSVVSHLLLLQDFYATGSINYVFWSIAVEWQIYFLFPLLVWGFRRHGALKVVALALLLGYALRLGLSHTRVARANPHFVGMFCLGMLAAYVAQADREPFKRWRTGFPWAGVAVASLGAAIGLTLYWGFRAAIHRFYVLDLPVGILATCLLVLSSRASDSPLRRLFALKPLAFIGTFSYSVYLLHAPLLQMMWQYLLAPSSLSPEQMFCALMSGGLIVVLVCAYLFFRVLERPFMSSGGSGHAAGAAVPKVS